MNTINDEMLNKYIDNELNNEVAYKVKDAIANSPELQLKYSTLLKTNELLKSINSGSVTSDFTKKILQRIQNQKVRVKQQKRFLIVTVSILGVIALGIVGFILAQILSTPSQESNQIVSTYSKDISDYTSAIFGKKNVSIFGSILSFIMLVSGYFLYEYQKRSKNNFSH
jgi:anti-sigma factor RsiW